ncbi:MAG TPA: (2Fe-2S)-binding protein [bacterium]|nr:(2Fe-2S)-binding protein [bacterium]HOL34948.1 (2Fe-2S)-binding protein [bacterium]HPP09109.1 (2Fe-2S)-binding protein [bacterium]HXK45726.1 (2Fe-2S)-binding protein [bacterium]
MKKDRIICRCKEITEGQILEVIKKGITDADGVKRALGAGMGLCQGKTCTNLIIKIISQNTNVPVKNIRTQTSRAPVRPIPIKIISEQTTGD